MMNRFAAFLAVTVVTTITACGKEKAPVAKAARPDSASGEVAQYALMRNSIGWLTDSNVVALATQVNGDAQNSARLESQAWSREVYRFVAGEILRDHARMQVAIDSVASLRRIPSQLPAVAPEMKAPYDSLMNEQAGLPMAEREAKFVDLLIREHERSIADFSVLAGNATDLDLKALLVNRAIMMEQMHIARARMLADAIARADSARLDSLKAKEAKRGGRR